MGVSSHNIFNHMIISKKVEFSASHICRSPQLSDEENLRVYGLAANPNSHGHNYSFADKVPTVENMAIDMWKRIEAHIDATGRARLFSVRVHETNELFVEYRGKA